MTGPDRQRPAAVPRLRREPPGQQPDRTGRRAVLLAALFFVVLIVAVVVPLVVIGLHNSGVKIPPTPSRSVATTPAEVGGGSG